MQSGFERGDAVGERLGVVERAPGGLEERAAARHVSTAREVPPDLGLTRGVAWRPRLEEGLPHVPMEHGAALWLDAGEQRLAKAVVAEREAVAGVDEDALGLKLGQRDEGARFAIGCLDGQVLDQLDAALELHEPAVDRQHFAAGATVGAQARNTLLGRGVQARWQGAGRFGGEDPGPLALADDSVVDELAREFGAEHGEAAGGLVHPARDALQVGRVAEERAQERGDALGVEAAELDAGLHPLHDGDGRGRMDALALPLRQAQQQAARTGLQEAREDRSARFVAALDVVHQDHQRRGGGDALEGARHCALDAHAVFGGLTRASLDVDVWEALADVVEDAAEERRVRLASVEGELGRDAKGSVEEAGDRRVRTSTAVLAGDAHTLRAGELAADPHLAHQT